VLRDATFASTTHCICSTAYSRSYFLVKMAEHGLLCFDAGLRQSFPDFYEFCAHFH